MVLLSAMRTWSVTWRRMVACCAPACCEASRQGNGRRKGRPLLGPGRARRGAAGSEARHPPKEMLLVSAPCNQGPPASRAPRREIPSGPQTNYHLCCASRCLQAGGKSCSQTDLTWRSESLSSQEPSSLGGCFFQTPVLSASERIAAYVCFVRDASNVNKDEPRFFRCWRKRGFVSKGPHRTPPPPRSDIGSGRVVRHHDTSSQYSRSYEYKQRKAAR